jgi:hypothetical protein
MFGVPSCWLPPICWSRPYRGRNDRGNASERSATGAHARRLPVRRDDCWQIPAGGLRCASPSGLRQALGMDKGRGLRGRSCVSVRIINAIAFGLIRFAIAITILGSHISTIDDTASATVQRYDGTRPGQIVGGINFAIEFSEAGCDSGNARPVPSSPSPLSVTPSSSSCSSYSRAS